MYIENSIHAVNMALYAFSRSTGFAIAFRSVISTSSVKCC